MPDIDPAARYRPSGETAIDCGVEDNVSGSRTFHRGFEPDNDDDVAAPLPSLPPPLPLPTFDDDDDDEVEDCPLSKKA